MCHILEAKKVLDDDSSNFLLFFNSSSFNLSRQQLTWYQTPQVDELQPVQKGVVKSWVGPLSLKLVLSQKWKSVSCRLTIIIQHFFSTMSISICFPFFTWFLTVWLYILIISFKQKITIPVNIEHLRIITLINFCNTKCNTFDGLKWFTGLYGETIFYTFDSDWDTL